MKKKEAYIIQAQISYLIHCKKLLCQIAITIYFQFLYVWWISKSTQYSPHIPYRGRYMIVKKETHIQF